MSDERLPWPFGPPPTEEQIAEMRRQRVKRAAANEALYREVIPQIQSARDTLRNIVALGFADDRDNRLGRARKHLAVLEEDIRAILVQPPEDP